MESMRRSLQRRQSRMLPHSNWEKQRRILARPSDCGSEWSRSSEEDRGSGSTDVDPRAREWVLLPSVSACSRKARIYFPARQSHVNQCVIELHRYVSPTSSLSRCRE